MQKQLSKEQQQEYNKIKENQLSAIQQEVAVRCLKYYLDYRENVNIPYDKISLAFKCAFFMAEKSQFSVNMKGQKVRGIAFSLNKLLKDHKLDDTMFMLKQMTKKLTNIDEDTNTYMNSIVKQISFLITLHSKFEKTFSQKLELKQKINDGGSYAKLFTSYAWLLFIIVKNQVLKRSLQLLPNTCMVAHIISSMLILAWDYIKPQGLMRGDKRLNESSSQRQIKRIIKQKVLQIFCIKDLNQYSKIANSFEEHFNHMSEMRLFRMNQQKWDFLSPQNIHVNYRKLDKYYQSSLSMEHLDQRIFFKQRTMNLTPSKFTPFARQGYANKYQKQPLGGKIGGPSKPTKQQTFNSHRVLNYEIVEKQLQTKSVPIQDIKLPKNIIQSPSMVKVPLVMATPISTGMQMYNFINEKKKRIKQIHTQQRSLDKNIFLLIDQVFDFHRSQNDKINKDTKLQMIVALYKIFSEEYLNANSYEKDTPDLMRAFLGLSMELVFFVSNISLTFEKIEQELQIQPFEMWKAIDYFIKSDKLIPYPIKLHFLDLQTNFVSFKIWQNLQMVKRIANFGSKSAKQVTQSQVNHLEKLFKRTVHQVAFQISRLTSLLDIDQNNSQKIFQIMKQILINNSQLLYKRHIDQLIICSIYLTCKLAGGYKIMFNDIKECYMSSNTHLKDIVQDIIVRVYMNDDKYDDIITFYNQIFIQNEKFKEFITNIRNNNGNNLSASNVNKNSKKNAVMNSPLKLIIPKLNFKQKNNPGTKNNSMTPQTQLLYAYNQSPILKYESKTFKHQLKSKVMLTYDLQQDQPKKNKSIEQQFGMQPTSDNNINLNHNTANTPSNQNNNFQATSDYISKKYIKKSTTPTNCQSHGITIHSHHHQSSHQYPQQLHIPLQTIAKQNMNPPASSSSHRTLFEQNKKESYGQTQIDETKYKNRNYQFAAFKRQ